MRKVLACECGDRRFAVRLKRDEQVGLVTCTKENHHSLLLDSRDYWHDVIQTGRPREARCRCGGRAFEVELDYELREDQSVRSVDVRLRCVGCASERIGATFEIDYDPTEPLISQPLDPCPQPWLKAKQTELSALWLPSDVEDVVSYVGEQKDVRCYLAVRQERPERLVSAAVCAAVRAALTDEAYFHLFFSVRDLEFPGELRDCWKRFPAIHLPAPFNMIYNTGKRTLYRLQWAEEYLVDGQVIPQEEDLLELTRRLRNWLSAHFTSERGEGTFDNPGEYRRMRGGS